MYSRAPLGTLLVLCSLLHPAVGREKDKAKELETNYPKELAPRTITLEETNISLNKALK